MRDIFYQGRTIMFVDFEKCTPAQIFAVIKEGKAFIEKKPEKSVLTLTNCAGLHYTHDNLQAFKQWVLFNEPYVMAAAIYGLSGMLRVGYKFVVQFTKRVIPEFPNQEAALEWLVTQPQEQVGIKLNDRSDKLQ